MLRHHELHTIYDNFEDNKMKCNDFLQNFDIEYSIKVQRTWSECLKNYYFTEIYEFEMPDVIYQLFLKYLKEIDIDN